MNLLAFCCLLCSECYKNEVEIKRSQIEVNWQVHCKAHMPKPKPALSLIIFDRSPYFRNRAFKPKRSRNTHTPQKSCTNQTPAKTLGMNTSNRSHTRNRKQSQHWSFHIIHNRPTYIGLHLAAVTDRLSTAERTFLMVA